MLDYMERVRMIQDAPTDQALALLSVAVETVLNKLGDDSDRWVFESVFHTIARVRYGYQTKPTQAPSSSEKASPAVGYKGPAYQTLPIRPSDYED